MNLDVIVAAYNEQGTLGPVIEDLRSLSESPTIIVVDDGSTDGTPEVLRRLAGPDLRVLTHEMNRGKGAAVRAGISVSTGDIVALHDADLELSAEPIPTMARVIQEGLADAVFGTRFGGKEDPVGLSRWANGCLTAAANGLYRASLADISCGQKAFDGRLLRSLPLRAEGFELEAELTALTLQAGARILEVSVPYQPRCRAQGKKVRYVRDGWRSLMTLVRLRLAAGSPSDGEDRVLP